MRFLSTMMIALFLVCTTVGVAQENSPAKRDTVAAAGGCCSKKSSTMCGKCCGGAKGQAKSAQCPTKASKGKMCGGKSTQQQKTDVAK